MKPTQLIHMPKTRSAWLHKATNKPWRSAEAHLPARAFPDAWCVGVLRDPWSWYASVFAQATSGTSQLKPLVSIFTGPDMTLESFVEGCQSDARIGAACAEGRPFLFGTPGLSDEDCEMISRLPGGLWSRAVRWWFGSGADRTTRLGGVDMLLDFHDLNEGITQVPKLVVDTSVEAMNESAKLYKPLVQIPHRDAWTSEMIAVVAEGDDTMIEKWGCRFYEPSSKSNKGVIYHKKKRTKKKPAKKKTLVKKQAEETPTSAPPLSAAPEKE